MKKVSGIIVDIENRRQFPGTVCFEKGKIADILHEVSENDIVYPDDAISDQLPYILPGFVDSHLYLEMTNLSPAEYARAAFSQGVIAAAVSTNDTSAILGLKGILALLENAKKSPFYFGFSAPATLSKGIYELPDVEKLLSLPEVTHLGVIENFPDVILHETTVETLFALAKKYGKPADGFAPGLSSAHLSEYCASYISTDCGSVSYEDAQKKIEQRLAIQIPTRISEEYKSFLPLFDIASNTSHLMLCSNIIYGANIPSGYINRSAAKAIESGYDIYRVLQAAVINPVKHYKLGSGLLHRGDNADFIVVDSLHRFEVLRTYIKGTCVYDATDLSESELGAPADISKSMPAKTSLKPLNQFSAHAINAEDIQIRASATSSENEALVTVIEAMGDETCTIKRTEHLPVKNGCVCQSIEKDCLKAVLVSRNGTFKPVSAFVHGFKMKKGAIALSISHDEHNIIAVGTTDEDLVLAVNTVISMNGGTAYVTDGKVGAQIQFDFAGLLSTKPFEEYKTEYDKTADITRNQMEIKIKRPVRVLTYLADTNVPTIKLSPRGLFNVATQELIPVVIG